MWPYLSKNAPVTPPAYLYPSDKPVRQYGRTAGRRRTSNGADMRENTVIRTIANNTGQKRTDKKDKTPLLADGATFSSPCGDGIVCRVGHSQTALILFSV